MCRRTPAFCSVFTRHRLSQNHPHTKAVLFLGQSLLDLFISLKCALSSAMSQIRQRTTWRRFTTSRVAVAWCHLLGRLPSVFFADIDRYNKGKSQHLTAAAMQCGSLYNCRSPDLQSRGVAKCRLVSRREASVWRSSCTPEGKTRTPHHVEPPCLCQIVTRPSPKNNPFPPQVTEFFFSLSLPSFISVFFAIQRLDCPSGFPPANEAQAPKINKQTSK